MYIYPHQSPKSAHAGGDINKLSRIKNQSSLRKFERGVAR